MITTTKKSSRKRPTEGTVVCLPLLKGGYAYGTTHGGRGIWLFNFITNLPAFDKSLMLSANWFQYVSCQNDEIGASTFDVGFMPLSQEEKRHVRLWRKVYAAEIENGAPTPYEVDDLNISDPSKQTYYVTEAELPQYQEYMMLTPKKLLDYLEANRHRLKVIDAKESQSVEPPSEPHQEVFEPISVFDIWLSGLEHMKLTEADEIADEINDELEKHSAGEVAGTGQVVYQDQHNIAVRNAPGKNKQALACIRRVLKRLNADPETTDIWEQKPDAQEHVAHSL